MSPPGWDVDDDLARAMVADGLEYVASARDLFTPVADDANTAMSGLWGVPLLHPRWCSAAVSSTCRPTSRPRTRSSAP